MKPKNALEKIETLLVAVNFTTKEAKQCGVSAETLAYYAKTGELERLGRGVYRGIHAPSIQSFQWDDLVTAVRSVENGVICLTSALALYDLTEEIPRQHWIAINHGTSHHTDLVVKVVRMRNFILGKTTVDIGGITVPIFDRERTILDAFRYLSKETALKALKTGLEQPREKKLDINKLRSYAKKMKINIDPYLLALTI